MVTVAELANKAVRRNPRNITTRFSFLLPDTLMGLEVEVDSSTGVESVHPSPDSVPSWRVIRDGSLRVGFEYTLAHPMCGATLGAAIEELYKPPSDFKRTFTGSTHIHIDMLEEDVTLDVLRTLVLLVYTLEPVLYASGDATREWCGYANSLATADSELLATLFSDNVNRAFRRTYSRGSTLGRYYGLNLAALTDYGSVEFRYFPTATSPEELVNWVNLVQSFKKAALEIGTVANLARIINDRDSYNEMVNNYFGPYVGLFDRHVEWTKVQSMFAKAGIIAKDNALPNVSYFRGVVAFSGERFRGLVDLPSNENFQSTLYSSGNVPPNASPNDVLVYGGNVYIRQLAGWASITEEAIDADELPQSTLDNLRIVADTCENELPSRIMECVRIVLERGRLMDAEDDIFQHEDDRDLEEYVDPLEDYDEPEV